MVTWPTNEDKKVSHGYGDSESMPPYQGNPHFHRGTDIPGTASGANATRILAVVAGTLRRDGRYEDTFYIEPDASTGLADRLYYCHCRSFAPMGHVTEGQHILNLKHITNWVESSHVCDHLHFEIATNSTPSESIRNPLDLLPHDASDHHLRTTIEQFRYVRRRGETDEVRYITERSPVVADAFVVRSGIVVIARGEDVMGYPNWTPGAHKMEFEVKNGPIASARVPKMKLFEWTGRIPRDALYRVVFCMGPRPCNSTYHFNYYVVTNTDGNDISDAGYSQWWETKSTAAGAAGNGIGGDEARLNSQAFFPDGRYSVEATGTDIKGGTSVDTKTVIVDNFKPFVKRLVVRQSGTVKYDAAWPETDSGLGSLRKDTDETCLGGRITVEVTFSESMDRGWGDFRVAVGQDGGAPVAVSEEVAWSQDRFNDDKWSGSVTLPQDARTGDIQVSVRARDLVGNELDTNPATIATYDRVAGRWTNDNPGTDVNHRFKFDATRRGSVTARVERRPATA